MPITVVHDASIHSPYSVQLPRLSAGGKDEMQAEVASATNISTLQCISVTSGKEYVVKNHDIADSSFKMYIHKPTCTACFP